MRCSGASRGGLDFEKRILQIYDTCRQPEQIEAAFNTLQAELEEVIADRIKDTQSQLLENFDEDVHDRLKLRLDEAEARLDKFGRWFWGVTRYALSDSAHFDEQSYAFSLSRPPQGIAPGRYQLIRGRIDQPTTDRCAVSRLSSESPPRRMEHQYQPLCSHTASHFNTGLRTSTACEFPSLKGYVASPVG